MFADFLRKLVSSQPGPLPEPDARLALASLLVRVARADGDYSNDESNWIRTIISKRYGLDTAQTAALLSQAEQLETEAPDTVRFTRAIKAAVAYEDRVDIVESLWQVVLADGVRAHEEDTVLRLVANLLGVSDIDSAHARQRVQQQ